MNDERKILTLFGLVTPNLIRMLLKCRSTRFVFDFLFRRHLLQLTIHPSSAIQRQWQHSMLYFGFSAAAAAAATTEH